MTDRDLLAEMRRAYAALEFKPPCAPGGPDERCVYAFVRVMPLTEATVRVLVEYARGGAAPTWVHISDGGWADWGDGRGDA